MLTKIKCYSIIFLACETQAMREWLSGGAPPCQGGGRGFDPRLALFLLPEKAHKQRACGTSVSEQYLEATKKATKEVINHTIL